MRRVAHRAVAVCALLGFLAGAVTAAEIRRTATYEMSFGYSFMFDVCGAAEHGRLIRRVIAETVARCDFPLDEKEWFRNWAIEFEAKTQASLVKSVQEHGGPPEHLDGGVTCEQMRATAAAQHDRLAQYEAGELRTPRANADPATSSLALTQHL
jgi:hypothetical protein